MTFNTKEVMRVMGRIQEVVDEVERFPQIRPLAREILLPLMKGREEQRAKGRPKRIISAAQRKQMSIAAKKRWKEVKKAGRNKLGG